MSKKKILALLIFLLCVIIPIMTLSLFPTSCGYGLCLLIYYPIIFLIGGISAWAYFKFSDRIKLNKTVLFLLIFILDLTLLTYFYPKGEFFPANQIRLAKQVQNDYEKLKPIDIFKATKNRNFLLISALYHKYKLPRETYNVSYCLIDKKGSCDTIFKEFNYFIMDNKVVTDNSNFTYNLNLNEGSFSFSDRVKQTDFVFKVGYPDFGKYKNTFTNTSGEITDQGEKITGLVKDVGRLRIIVDENNPKFEYGFTRLFEEYLSLTK